MSNQIFFFVCLMLQKPILLLRDLWKSFFITIEMQGFLGKECFKKKIEV